MAAFFHALLDALSWNARYDTNKKIPSLRKAGEGNKGILLTERGILHSESFLCLYGYGVLGIKLDQFLEIGPCSFHTALGVTPDGETHNAVGFCEVAFLVVPEVALVFQLVDNLLL